MSEEKVMSHKPMKIYKIKYNIKKKCADMAGIAGKSNHVNVKHVIGQLMEFTVEEIIIRLHPNQSYVSVYGMRTDFNSKFAAHEGLQFN